MGCTSAGSWEANNYMEYGVLVPTVQDLQRTLMRVQSSSGITQSTAIGNNPLVNWKASLAVHFLLGLFGARTPNGAKQNPS